MPRGKSTKTAHNSKRGSASDKKTVWVNVRLEPVDEPELERYGGSSAEIFAEFIGLSLLGADLGVKWVDGGETVMAYIIVDDAENDARRVGVAGYGGNATDAINSVCYKYFVKLGAHATAGDVDTKPRFR